MFYLFFKDIQKLPYRNSTDSNYWSWLLGGVIYPLQLLIIFLTKYFALHTKVVAPNLAEKEKKIASV